MPFPSGYLVEHPLPSRISGPLGISGYQLLADVRGVGAGRRGVHAFLLVAPDPDPALPDAGTQLALHHTRVRDDAQAAAFIALAAELGHLRLSGYRLVLERDGLRSTIHVVDPATGAVVAVVPDRHPSGFIGRSQDTAGSLAARLRALPAAGPLADADDPKLLRGALLALALRDDSLGGAAAAELADRALALIRSGRDCGAVLDAPAAMEAARAQG